MPRSLLTTTIRDEVETIPRQCVKEPQLKRLRAGVECFAADFPHVRRGEAGIDDHNIRSFDDLARLPFSTKADLCHNDAYQAFGFPARVQIDDNWTVVLRPRESAFVLISDNAPHETRM